jgi:hypothetical protein
LTDWCEEKNKLTRIQKRHKNQNQINCMKPNEKDAEKKQGQRKKEN